MERGRPRITLERLRTIASLYKMDLSELIKIDTLSIIRKEDIEHHSETRNNEMTHEERNLFIETVGRLEKENSRLLRIIENLSMPNK